MRRIGPPASQRSPASWATLLLIGFIGGALFGALGAGGGIVMVPLLLIFALLDQRHAAAASLLAVVPTAVGGSVSYLAAGHLDVLAALLIACGGVVGSLVGTRLLRVVPLVWLRWLFIAVLIGFTLRLVFTSPERAASLDLSSGVAIALILLGFVTGVAAGLFGIGGGVIIVPVLIAVLGTGDLDAKGTALLAMIPMAAVGTIANLRARLVDWHHGLPMGAGALAGVVGGSLVAFGIPPRLSVILFAGLSTLIVVQLIIRAIRLGRAG